MNENIDELVEEAIKIHPNANKKVLDFIYSFLFASRDVEQVETIRKQFRAGYCYYFAEMLRIAFNRGEVCWAAPYGHMVWMDINRVPYDIEGVNESEVEYYIPISYIGEGIKDFKHIKGEEFNASQDFIDSVIERYKGDLKEDKNEKENN